MAIELDFNPVNNTPEIPTLVLAKKNGERIGQLRAENIKLVDNFNNACEISFETNKYYNGKLNELWYEIYDFRLIWCKEWNQWFELTCEVDENSSTIKTVNCIGLGVAELSQLNLYGVEINTETDIEREEYERPTIFYDPAHHDSSLMHRITEKCPHYEFVHIDAQLAKIQRTFEFEDISIYDAFVEIGKEVGCWFDVTIKTDIDGKMKRTIAVYDLMNTCNECGFRGEYIETCPECGSSDIYGGYGEDTTLFITSEDLGNDIRYSVNTDQVKNCFKLVGGDELMTATIRNINPNGTDYIWRITDYMRRDMSQQLIDRLAEYDKLYLYCQKEEEIFINESNRIGFNRLINKYKNEDNPFTTIPSPMVGFPQLMENYYTAIDLELYLRSSMMPTYKNAKTNANKEVEKLQTEMTTTVAVASLAAASKATTDNSITTLAKVICDSRYRIKINNSSYNTSTHIWSGSITLTNYSDEEDTATTRIISITITDRYETYVRQLMDKAMNKEKVDDFDVTGLFKMNIDGVRNELKKYAYNPLKTFLTAGNAALNILVEQGIADKLTWGNGKTVPDLYKELYQPWFEKVKAIESELKVRQSELDTICGTYSADDITHSKPITLGTFNYLLNERNKIQEKLNFENFLGEDLLLEFSVFRRDDKYENTNYISEGLDNSELFKNAREFVKIANSELYKASELQHTINISLYNLLTMERYRHLLHHFKVGNWLRTRVDDKIYKLRLINYALNFSDLTSLQVEFSDVVNIKGGISDQQSIMNKVSSIATSYDSIKRQAEQGVDTSAVVDGWFERGLDVTNMAIMQVAEGQTQTWDSNGMLFRQYDDVTDTYYDEQLKIINSTLAVTDDNWETIKTAIGKFYYYDPTDEYKLHTGYGINAELVIGKMILGESLGLYNDDLSMSFDKNGLTIKNSANAVSINPNLEQLFTIAKGSEKIFYVDSFGNLQIIGNLNAGQINIGDGAFTVSSVGNVHISKGSISIGGTSTNPNFRVTNGGTLTAVNGNFSGTITGSEIYAPYIASSTSNPVFYIDGDGRNGKGIGHIHGATFYQESSSDTKRFVELKNGNIYLGKSTGIYFGGNKLFYTTGEKYTAVIPVDLRSNKIELYGDSAEQRGYVDFHWKNRANIGTDYTQQEDYTSRIEEIASGKLNLLYDVNVVRNLTVEGSFNAASRAALMSISGEEALNMNKLSFSSSTGTLTSDSMVATGTKSRKVKTDNYGDRLLYCYETASPYFGDIGTGMTDETGITYIDVDPIFSETIITDNYCVFLQEEGEGKLYIKEKTPTYFIVAGTPNLKFSWELKSKQKDFPNYRLDTPYYNIMLDDYESDDRSINLLDDALSSVVKEDAIYEQDFDSLCVNE